jgi:tRNA1Val (adenine37-N6)-methyltransferase
MPQETFVFKQFTIHQDKCPMKVGTDAVLLGAWIRPGTAKRILDIGTGTGILAIMLAQKSTAAIDAIDIDVEAVEQARQNADFCKWRERVKVAHASLQQFSKAAGSKYDLIVSNPPYFIDSSKPPEEGRTLARHNDYLPFDELVEGVVKLLEPHGKFFVILPNKEAIIFKDLAEKKGLKLSRLLRVRTKHDKATEKRHIMQFEFHPASFSEDSIVIEKEGRHEYTDEYKELTKDYYIHF